MNAQQFLSYLCSLDIKISVDGDQLSCKAPKGVLTNQIQSQIAQYKTEILTFLHQKIVNRNIIPRPTNTQNIPLSFAQERLWFVNQLEGNLATYNMPAALRLHGGLNLAAFEQALKTIVHRHEALRTSFIEIAGTVQQLIHPQVSFQPLLVDLRQLPENEREQALSEQLARAEAHPFDLKQAPLLRVCIWQLSEQEYICLLNMHHIISDGWSIGVIVQELASLYSAYCEGSSSPLPELAIQYADFAIWQKQWLQGGVLEQQIAYWKSNLEEAPTLLQLPTDRPRPSTQTYRGATYSCRLSPQLTEQAQSLSMRTGSTLFMTLLAGFSVLMYRYSGQSDIIIGSPIANRNRQEIESLIGFFVNTLVLRTKLEEHIGFEQVLAQVKSNTLRAYEYQDTPFERIVEALQPERSLSHSPLFQVMFVLQNTPMSELQLPGLTLSEVNQNSTVSKFDLTLSLSESSSGMSCYWEYNTDLFDDQTIERMATHFEILLLGLFESPNQPVNEISLLTDSERQQLLYEWNDTKIDYPKDKCIHQLFEEQVDKTPEAIAIVFEEQSLTYRELNERANQLARHLHTLGIKPEVLVGICVERSLEMVVGLLGILKAGGAYVPIDPEYPQERLTLVLLNSGISLILTQEDLLKKISGYHGQVVCLDRCQEIITALDGQKLELNISSENLAYTIYTSGSTGKPKGVQIKHNSVVNFLRFMSQKLKISKQDIFLSVTTLSFDIAVLEIFLPIMVGAKVELVSREVSIDGRALAAKLSHSKATMMQATPATWQLLLAANWQGSKHLKILCGGEALPKNLVSQLKSRCAVLWNLYGPTETTIWSAIYQVSTDDDSVLIGHPIANTQIYILDKNLIPVPIGVAGELHIGGDGLARGYLNQPELTKEKFISNPFDLNKSTRLYKTGDLARYLPDGNIEFIGRIDSQVKIRGFRIELGEIETALSNHPQIQQSIALVTEGSQNSKRLVAYLVSQDENLTSAQLREYLQRQLPSYMVPNAFIILERFPLTPNGKVDRKALLTIESGKEISQEYIAPSTAAEQIIANIFSEVLTVKSVSLNDDFFELGGHSLLATQLVSRLRQAFEVEIPLASIFSSPTVSQLEQKIREIRSKGQGLSLSAVQPRPTDIQEIPLSFAQERLWFINQLEGDAATYNMPAAFRLNGELNMVAFEQALTTIIHRHEALRTSFIEVAGTAQQVIHVKANLQPLLVDLRHLPKDEQEKTIKEQLSQAEIQPFDLKQAPLLRVCIWQLSEQEFVCLVNMHHIVSDGWSTGIIIQELAALYSAYCEGAESPLPELAIQYADFAIWQRQWLQGEVLEQQVEYWKSNLEGAPDLLQLPTDRPRPSIQTYRGTTYNCNLSPQLTEKVQALSRQRGSTLFITLLAGFSTLMYRYSGQSDIVIGSPIANRNQQEIESLIGFFVNTLVLRTKVDEQISFEQLLTQVKSNTLKAYKHQDTPFERIVEALQPERSLSHSPLFQVMFDVQNTPMGELELPGLTLNEVAQISTVAKFDLSLSVTESPDGLTCGWEYNTDLFDGQTIERMATHFETLLSSLVENPSQPVNEIPLLSESEYQRLIHEWNGTATEYPNDKCVHQLFEEQVARTPETIAVVFEEQSLTYSELNERANQLAHHLQILGVKPEVLVGICVERSLEMVVGLLGILKAGGAYVPLDPSYPSERLSYMLADAEIDVLLTQQSLVNSLPSIPTQIMCLDSDWSIIATQSQENPPPLVRPENLAYVIYTSGSTGQPKGVLVAHQSLVERSLTMSTKYHLTCADRVLQFAALSFDVALEEIIPTWFTGATLVLGKSSILNSMTDWVEFIEHQRLSVVNLPAAFWQEWVASQQGVPSCLRLVIAGSEAVQWSKLIEWQQQVHERVEFYNAYGVTEATITAIVYQPERGLGLGAGIVPIGKPVANTQVYILDSNLNPVPIGVAGELHIGGEGLARGYLNQPELTKEKFISNPFDFNKSARLYKTGDLARYLPDGNIEFVGRIDSQVKIRGFRIELGEIETALSSHPQIQQSIALVTEDSQNNKRLVAYLVSQDENLTSAQLREYLQQQLPTYMVPSTFVILESLPLTPNGKVDRKALLAIESGKEISQEYIAPSTAAEQIIANIFSEVLTVKSVSLNDDFFELGGHSLLATQLVSRLRQAFEVEIPLASIFSSPTVSQLEQKIREIRSKGQGLSLSAVQPRPTDIQEIPLSFAQERLWFINQLEGDAATYNMPAAFRLNGELNMVAFEQALTTIIHRHEALRTSFIEVAGTAQQVIHVKANLQPLLVDLRHLPKDEQEKTIKEQLSQAEIQPFDLKQAPLLRVCIWQLSEQEFVCLVNMHHIVSDGWSTGIIIQELAALYSAYCEGAESPLPELAIQYADFAIWQRQWLQGEVLEQQVEYWKSNLEGAPDLLQLPTDRPRPSIQTYRGTTYNCNLSPQLTEKVQALSRQRGSTLFITLLAGFSTLMYRYSGQSDIVIGSPIANRNQQEIESLIGFFVNTLVLRTKVDEQISFEQLLTQVKSNTLKAYKHQDTPFERIVEALQPERSLSHSPLFQVMFDVQNTPMGELELPGLTLNEVAQISTVAKFDLSLSVTESPDGLTCGWEYNTDLFDGQTIERMAKHFEILLIGVTENPNLPISTLTILTASEQQQLLVDWNDTQVEYPREQCIHQLFEAQVNKTPEAIAIVCGDEQLTYQELNTRANQLAHHLQTLGIKPEVPVGVCVSRSIEMMVGIIGVLKAGGAYVPLDPTYPAERLAYMLTDSQLLVLLTQDSLRANLPNHTAQVVCLDTDWPTIAQHSGNNCVSAVSPTNLVYIIYTSGSTGKPKGTMIQHQSLVSYTTTTIREYGMQPTDKVLQFCSISFDVAAEEIYPCLSNGGALVLRNDEMLGSIANFLDTCRAWGITMLSLPTAYWHEIVAALGTQGVTMPEAMRLVIIAGERARPEQLVKWQKYCVGRPRLINTYGVTESTIISTIGELTYELPSAEVSVGKVIDNTQIYLLDKCLQPVPIMIPGEMYLGGLLLARGYFNRPDLTAEKFIPHPFSTEPGARIYKTGDLARYREDGSIECLGRIDQQVKIRGFRVELGEVESAISKYPQVTQVTVIDREDIPGNKQLVAYIVPQPSQDISNTELRTFLKEQLPSHMIPAAFVCLNEFPFTPNGKIDRKALPAPDFAQLQSEEYVAPRNEAEEQLSIIWQEVLGVERVGVHDIFFELGGHSLLATQVMSRIRQTFEVEVPLRKLFEFNTIDTLATQIQSYQANNSKLGIIHLRPFARTGNLPLSFAQQRLWFLDQLEPNSSAYNMPGAVKLQGQLDLAVLEKTLSEVVRRHESLRTNFIVSQDGQPTQVINEPGDWRMNVIDLQQMLNHEREVQIQKIVSAEAAKLFALGNDSLLRVTVLLLSETEQILLLTIHHIVSDGWSIGVLIEEVATLYSAFIQGSASPLLELEIQYADFALWQREWLQGDTLQQQINYWQQQLVGAPALLDLPTDRPRPAIQTFSGADYESTISVHTAQALDNLTQQEGATLFMTLLAAFDTLLYRYTGQADIVVGSPIANRNYAEVENLIGFFANTLVLRNDLSDNPTFRELLRQVREVALSAYAHQDLPFEMLVETLHPERNLSYSPLFQVMFILQNTPSSDLQMPGVTLSPMAAAGSVSTFDITLSLTNTPEGLVAEWEYNTDLFNASTIERMAQHLKILLTGIAENPDLPISALPMLTVAEQQKLLVDWNNTQVEYPHEQCIHQLFEAQVNKTPEVIAIVCGDEQLTYQELNTRANQLAHYLQTLGIKQDEFVGLCVERSLEMIVGMLAILKAGGAYVPLDPEYPAERLAYMVADAQIPLLLTQERLLPNLPTHNAQVICLDHDWPLIQQASGDNLIVLNSPDSLAYVIYTSGSTGQPKGVMVTQQNLTNFCHAAISAYDITSADRILQFASVSFDVAAEEIYPGLMQGASIYLRTPEMLNSLPAFWQQCDAWRLTLLDLPTAYWQQLTTDLASIPASVRLVIIGGERANPAQVRLWQEQVGTHTQLINAYGPTETTVEATCCNLSQVQLSSGQEVPIGKPLVNMRTYILDSQLQLVPVGTPGELHIGGHGVARGYLNRPDLTAEKFIADPFSDEPHARLYKTGDLVRYLADGNIEYLGRIDQQVKIRGFRVELGEVESAISKHPQVTQVTVIDREDIPGNKQLVAYIVPQLSQGIGNTELRAFLKDQLPSHMIPAAFVCLNEFPFTPNGKIDRQALPTPDFAQLQSEEYVAPENDVEKLIADIWIEVLGVDQVGVHDNFFELGGHSLLAVQLISKMNQKFQTNLALSTLFQNTTVKQIASTLTQPENMLDWSPLVQIKSSGSKRPFFCIPGSGGNPVYLSDLAYQLDLDRPFYGLQARGLEGDLEPHTNVEDIAKCYIRAIQSIQESGPYVIGGHSFGGQIALEVALQFQKIGQEVGLLVMLDAGAPIDIEIENADEDDVFWLRQLGLAINELYEAQLNMSDEVLRCLNTEARFQYFQQQLVIADLPIAGYKINQLKGLLNVFKVQNQIIYQPSDMFKGQIVLFQSTEIEDEFSINADNLSEDWSRFSTKGIIKYDTPGNHYSMITEPHVQVLATSLRDCINQVVDR
jgi:amino acid adenylation domain-containing protein